MLVVDHDHPEWLVNMYKSPNILMKGYWALKILFCGVRDEILACTKPKEKGNLASIKK